MANTAATPTAPSKTDAAGATAGKKKRPRRPTVLAVLALVLIAAGGWFLLLGPGASSGPRQPQQPKPGAVLTLDPITMNLADGRLLKVGLALQLTAATPAEGEISGAVALDEAISFLGGHTYEELASPEGRSAAKTELSKRVSQRYDGDVMRVYFTEFVMQ